METAVDLEFIESLIEKKLRVSVYLVNGIKLQGTITQQNDRAMILEGETTQLIYKHAVSTVLPGVGK
jgi:host factor-I protein